MTSARSGTLAIAVLVVSASALVANCSCQEASVPCRPSNCKGCCTADGRCTGGDNGAGCGLAGTACLVCASTQLCTDGVCVAAPALPCEAFCSGCCTVDGICLETQELAACGARGERCAACAGNQQCTSSGCVDATCRGCVDATNGACIDGGVTEACGRNGVGCKACAAGASCDLFGNCVGGVCSGCVDFQGVCQPGNLNAACGKAADPCASCLGAQYCVAGLCAHSDAGTADAGAADAGTCASPCSSQPVALAPTCEPCVATICATDPYCCATRWDAQCATAAKTKCGSRCTGGDGGTADAGSCGSLCVARTTAMGVACDPCVGLVCAQDTACCTTQWDSQCVAEVTASCPGKCGSDAGTADSGTPDAGSSDGGPAVVILSCTSPAPYNTQNWTSSCGAERWAIKTGTDSQAGMVSLASQVSSIVQLSAVTPPPNISTSVRYPLELLTYRLKNVTLTTVKMETDSDYHLVISDGTHTMIAEIPYPGCVGPGSPFACFITHARGAIDAQINVTSTPKTPNLTISIVGVGMFDFDHSQLGKAPNGVELHPVLGICFGLNCQL